MFVKCWSILQGCHVESWLDSQIFDSQVKHGVPLVMWGVPRRWWSSFAARRAFLASKTSLPWPQGRWWVDFKGISKGNHGSRPPILGVSTRFPIIQHPKNEPQMLEFPLCKKKTWRKCVTYEHINKRRDWRSVVRSLIWKENIWIWQERWTTAEPQM